MGTRLTICTTWEDTDPQIVCGKPVALQIDTECDNGHKHSALCCLDCLISLFNENQDCTTCYASGKDNVTLKIIGIARLDAMETRIS